MMCQHCIAAGFRRERSTRPEAHDHRVCADVVVEMARRFGDAGGRLASVGLGVNTPGLGLLSASHFTKGAR